LADSEEELAHARSLEEQGFKVLVAHRSPLHAKLSALAALATRTPLSVAHYASRRLEQLIRGAACRVKFDLVVSFCSSMAQYADALPDVPQIVDFVDLDSQKWALYASYTPWPKSWIYRLESRRLVRYEKVLASRALFTLVRTEPERQDCLRLLGEGRFEVLANGVDLDYFRPDSEKIPSSELVFTGIMDYFPNVQAVQFFCRDILPLVQEVVPDVRFTIVGARPIQSVLELGSLAGVTVTGRVPDVRPYLQQAAAAVVPLKLARGIQNKVLEAMAMATPVVATKAAFRGIATGGHHGVAVCDEPRHFAEAINRFLKDPDARAEAGCLGRQFVERNFVWDKQLAKLDEVIDRAVRTTV